jgi:bacillithiol biosynthesis deacetylase BshB1
MKLDILVLAAHPDDAELSCGGTILAHTSKGKKVGVIDYTQGELGSNGTIETRYAEAAAASKIMGLAIRENLKFRDGFFQNDEAHQLATVRMIRKYKPEIVIGNAITDRHPDHAKAANLTRVACFLSGLRKIETFDDNGQLQEHWSPKQLFHCIQSDYIVPDFVVDISEFWEQKLEAVFAYNTQFYNPNSKDSNTVKTFIATPEFLKMLEGRAADLGNSIRTKYGEGFTKVRNLGIGNLFDIL